MIIKAFKCETCCDTIYSRCKEDHLATCYCGRVEVKNGPLEPEVLINGEALLCPNLIDLTTDADLDILYWDWNLMRNEYGYISEIPSLNEKTPIIDHEYA